MSLLLQKWEQRPTYVYESLLLVGCTLNFLLNIVNYSKRLKYYESYEIPKINKSFYIFQAFLALL